MVSPPEATVAVRQWCVMPSPNLGRGPGGRAGAADCVTVTFYGARRHVQRSAGRQFATTARCPPGGGQAESFDRAARLHLFEDPFVAGAPDAPGPVVLHVLVFVEG